VRRRFVSLPIEEKMDISIDFESLALGKYSRDLKY
jgi:hypothetical protein